MITWHRYITQLLSKYKYLLMLVPLVLLLIISPFPLIITWSSFISVLLNSCSPFAKAQKDLVNYVVGSRIQNAPYTTKVSPLCAIYPPKGELVWAIWLLEFYLFLMYFKHSFTVPYSLDHGFFSVIFSFPLCLHPLSFKLYFAFKFPF